MSYKKPMTPASTALAEGIHITMQIIEERIQGIDAKALDDRAFRTMVRACFLQEAQPDEQPTRVACKDCCYRKESWFLPGYRGLTRHWICGLSGRRVCSTESCLSSRKKEEG